jgi:hypothetical protein
MSILHKVVPVPNMEKSVGYTSWYDCAVCGKSCWWDGVSAGKWFHEGEGHGEDLLHDTPQ